MVLNIEVFTAPGCSKCGHALSRLKKVVSVLNKEKIHWREVNILEELDYAVELGVLATPAIAMNGRLVFTGTPSGEEIRRKAALHLADTAS